MDVQRPAPLAEGTFLTQAEFDALRKSFAKEIAEELESGTAAPSAAIPDSIILTNESLKA